MPSENHIAADPDGIAAGGKHYGAELASLVGKVMSTLESALAAHEQPDAYDDTTGKAFLKVYEPAKRDLLTLLDALAEAFEQTSDNVMATAAALDDAEIGNTEAAAGWGRRS